MKELICPNSHKEEGYASIEATKTMIIDYLANIKDRDTSLLLKYLNESDFFTARCHTHHCFAGGLALHSLGTARKMASTRSDIPEQSRIIVGLLHDICSSHHPSYNHIGRGHHGKRSVLLLDALGFRLTKEERHAIANHMHGVKKSWDEIANNKELQLRKLIHYCDHQDAATQPRWAGSPYGSVCHSYRP